MTCVITQKAHQIDCWWHHAVTNVRHQSHLLHVQRQNLQAVRRFRYGRPPICGNVEFVHGGFRAESYPLCAHPVQIITQETLCGRYGSTPVFQPVGTAPPRCTFVFDDPKSILRGRQIHVTPQIKDNSLRNTYFYVLGYVGHHIRK